MAKAKKPKKPKVQLQQRNGDSIVYVRMKPNMFAVFEAAYLQHVEENMLNPKSYGMSTFVREMAFQQIKP